MSHKKTNPDIHPDSAHSEPPVQMHPQANPQPFAVTSHHSSQAQQHPVQPSHSNSSETLGIISIVLAFIVPLVGLILGIIGYKRAHKEHQSTALSVIGIVISSMYMLVVVYVFFVFFGIGLFGSMLLDQATQDRAYESYDYSESEYNSSYDFRDKAAVNSLYAELELFYSENGYYPTSDVLLVNPERVLPYLDYDAADRLRTGFITYSPELCTEKGCAAYTASITLINGSTYSKSSLSSL